MNTLPIVLFLLLLSGLAVGCDNPAASEAGEPAGYGAEASADVLAKASADTPWRQEVARLRAATARYHDIERALTDGYTVEFTGYRDHMGFHYLNPPLLDGTFETERPEVLMYAPTRSGGLRFVGVEYAVPIADLAHPSPPPEGFTGAADVWAVNTEFSVWTLHVWVGLENPDGLFTPTNPRLP